jgi:hypothetical protein
MRLEPGTRLLREKYIRAELGKGGVKQPLTGTKTDQIKANRSACDCTAAKIATEGIRGIFRDGTGCSCPRCCCLEGITGRSPSSRLGKVYGM